MQQIVYNTSMVTIDHLLLELAKFTSPSMEEYLPKRDSKVLRSLTTILERGNFLTEKQAKLLLKILQDNKEKIPLYQENLEDMFKNPLWSKSFRVIEVIRTIGLGYTSEKDPRIMVDFTFSGEIRRAVQDLSKNVESFEAAINGKTYVAAYTEKNIVNLVDGLKQYNFKVDETIKKHYDTIKSWNEAEYAGQFHISAMSNTNFEKHITEDLGINSPLTPAIINDRRVRYQYVCDPIKNPENLTEKIAMRNSSMCWVGKNDHTLSEIFNSLSELKRFPVLVVFDAYDAKQCLENLQNLSENLEKNGIFNDIGIYFRLDNSVDGKNFNEFIAEKKYNTTVDKMTKVVGIQSGKIPKFLIKNEWKPMSVISIGNNLKTNKTLVYASTCDLIIPYTEKEPIITW